MKKILLGIFALGLLASCDPAKDDVSAPAMISQSELENGFTYKQGYLDESGQFVESSTGSYFTYSCPRVVTIFRKNASGGEVVLAKGASAGSFVFKASRGSDPNQTFYVRAQGFDGQSVTASYDVTLEVPGDLTPEMKLACSDAGTKIWKWDTSIREDGGSWGNLGYTPGEDWTASIWFSCPPADLTGQLQHSDTHVATGEENPNAYMVFSEEGTITTFDGSGNQIRKGSFTIDGYNGGAKTEVNGVAWKVADLITDAGTILFPFKINGGGTKPTKFDIVKLTADKLQLVYADAGTGGWSEATWWAFTSTSDAEGLLTNYSNTKQWMWDTTMREDGGSWGNFGYMPGEGSNWQSSIWFSCPPAELVGQLQHSDTHAATGEEDPYAYMIFDFDDATVTSYKADGTQIRKGAFEIDNWNQGNRNMSGEVAWNLGTLKTDAGSILFPFHINSGGFKPTEFEILNLDGDHLQLVYAAPGTGSWSEATWWAFINAEKVQR